MTDPRQRHRGREWVFPTALLLIAAGIWWSVLQLSSVIFGPGYGHVLAHAVRAVSIAVAVLLVLAVLLRLHPAARGYGLIPDRRSLRHLLAGAAGYAVPMAGVGAVVLALGLAQIDLPDGVPAAACQLLAVLVLVLLYEAIPEELIFRGYLFGFLADRVPIWATVVIQALAFCAFGFLIGAARTPDRLLLFLLMSLSIGVIRAISGSVYAAIGFHMLFQTATQPLLGHHWTAFTLDDPDLWFTDLAFGLGPMLLGPLLVFLLYRTAARRARR
ncbi:CPBP family intramembrane glutamic endopeptidase [Dietzia sp. PP-33]|uniref:CPBP family intramembrane glutamic endopeptidase n=1 Tax=Dietzia sp. PP-33 TaxID=2957500 RepID=UPI0029A0F5AE|nr:CPBP family intramembrane glutamic endopeptidase [Dietzia sp. PP-33]MDX2358733.1 CPBP family intramembrane metalloprotease [Dietzia sp. PP-33]